MILKAGKAKEKRTDAILPFVQFPLTSEGCEFATKDSRYYSNDEFSRDFVVLGAINRPTLQQIRGESKK